jgi:hypothetical protein
MIIQLLLEARRIVLALKNFVKTVIDLCNTDEHRLVKTDERGSESFTQPANLIRVVVCVRGVDP